MRVKGPLTCIGGKHRLSGWIISHFPEHYTFVDVFGGSGVITLQKDPAPVEVYNDLDGGLANFFKVLQDSDKFDEFSRRVSLTPYSYSEYERACELHECEGYKSDVEWAACYFIINRMVFGSKLQNHPGVPRSKSSLTAGWAKNVTETSRGVAKRVSAWLSSVDGLTHFAVRLLLVQVECRDFEYVLGTYDTYDSLFYCDPPYYGIDWYERSFSKDDHKRLLRILLKLDGMCVLSGYDCDLYYDTLEVGAGWYYMSKAATVGARNRDGEFGDRVESLWINPQAEERLPTSVRNGLERAE